MFGVSERWSESQSPQYARPRLSSKLRPNPRAGAKPRLCQSAAGSELGKSLHCAGIMETFNTGESLRKINLHDKAQLINDK